MRICYIIDGRSPIAMPWVRHFANVGHDVRVVSTRPCDPEELRPSTVRVLGASKEAPRSHRPEAVPRRAGRQSRLPRLAQSRLAGLAYVVRDWIAPITAPRRARQLRRILEEMSPDVVHAMRIPFEGILAAAAVPRGVPLVLSVWGNDFTLHAAGNPLVRRATRRALERADAVHADCRRDLRLAREEYAYDGGKPGVVMPGGGGMDVSMFRPGPADGALRRELGIPTAAPVVLNPRGFRRYVCSESFFRAIPIVLRKHPGAVFVSSAMAGSRVVEELVRSLGIGDHVRLLPVVAHDQMLRQYQLADVAVSPTVHDGTPNTLLEAMACGCFPVAGDLESVREWIDDGVNGLLCDPSNVGSLGDAICRALADADLRSRAREHNERLVRSRADRATVMSAMEKLYTECGHVAAA